MTRHRQEVSVGQCSRPASGACNKGNRWVGQNAHEALPSIGQIDVDLRERCTSRLLQLSHELNGLHPDDLDAEELLTYAREGAAHIERFVKQLAFTPPDTRLVGYIKELRVRGLPPAAADALHAIRKVANAGKHDPAAAVTLDQVRLLLDEARFAVAQIGVAGSAPGANAPSPPAGRRFAIVVSDYPTGGEVDCDICCLLDDGRTVSIDSYQLRYNDEAEVLASLAQRGNLDQQPVDPAAVRLRDTLTPSGEFSGVWLYDGDLRDLAEAFAPRQHSIALDSLQRKNNPTALRAAAAMAAVDLGGDAAVASQLNALLVNAYAVEGRMASAVAARVADLVRSAGLRDLDGPRLASTKRYDMAAMAAVARNSDIRMAIAPDGVLFVDVGQGYVPMP